MPTRLPIVLLLAAAAAGDLYPRTFSRLALDARGAFYVADLANARIFRVAPGERPQELPRRLGRPGPMALDAQGALYVADAHEALVRKRAPDGKVTVLLGPKQIRGVQALAFDAQGRLWLSEGDSVRRREADGTITTVFGQREAEVAQSLDGRGAAARCSDAHALAFAPDGALWFLDYDRVRRMAPDGLVTTLAGAMGQPARGHADGRGGDAYFAAPRGLVVDRQGVGWVADELNGSIRRVTADGRVTTVAGDRRARELGSRDGVGLAARFALPSDIVLGPDGDLFVVESLRTSIRRVARDGRVTTVVGAIDPQPVLYTDPVVDGPRGVATFGRPAGLAADGAGGLWVADADWHAIRRVAADGAVTTVAGDLATLDEGHRDGPRATARLQDPHAGVAGPDGSFYFVDQQVIRRVGPDGTVTTVAGDLARHAAGSRDGAGPEAAFNGPSALALDERGGLLVADTFNHAIRRVDLRAPGRPVTTIARQLREPRGVAVAQDGAVLVADSRNGRLQRLAPDGTQTTLATGFEAPQALAIDAAGTVWVAEPKLGAIHRVAPDGTYATVVEDPALAPAALAPDGRGGLWLADADNRVVRHLAPDGTLTTVAGQPGRARR